MIRLLAGSMAVAAGSAWLLMSRWERLGRGAEHRARLHAPRLIGVGFVVGLVGAPIVYSVLVAVAPGWAYEGRTNWSSGIDVVLQTIGVGLWILGMAVSLWAARVMGRYLAVGGVVVDHELVTRGPYHYVRHPFYTSLTAVALGTALVFRSYLLLGLSVVGMLSSLWGANAEERLLASSGGFGDVYRAYAARTGRFFPRLRRVPE